MPARAVGPSWPARCSAARARPTAGGTARRPGRSEGRHPAGHLRRRPRPPRPTATPSWSTCLGRPPAGDRPGRPGTPSPAMVAATRTLPTPRPLTSSTAIAAAMGIPAWFPRPLSDHSAVTDTFIREGRACGRQRHADAGGRFPAVARQASGESEPRSFVNRPAVSRSSSGHAAGRAGRCAPAGYGRARPAGGMPAAKSAVPGHGRPGGTPRASCPWASAHTPQRHIGGGVGLREDRELWWSLRSARSPSTPIPPAPFPLLGKGERRVGLAVAAASPRCGPAAPPVRVRPLRPARSLAAGPPRPPAGPLRGPAPFAASFVLLVHYYTCVFQKQHRRFSRVNSRFSRFFGFASP